MSDLEGTVISGYFLQQCLSEGGVADVYRAQGLGREEAEVVIKVFRYGYVQRPAFRDYFLSEAEKIWQLRHPHILPFLEYGQEKDLLYVIMPYIPTGNLDTLLLRVGGRFPAMQALPIMQQLCGALTYVHAQQNMHGNLKPQNIFVAQDGRMLLADFGIMHGFDDSQQSLTRIGWGSAEYASPEQSLGIQHHASDIYSLGVVLFRILAGTPPFAGQTPVEVLLKHVRQPAPSIRSLVPTISDAVDSVLLKALQKRADERYSSAKDFYDAFHAAVTLAPIASPVARSITRILPATSEQPSDPLQSRSALRKFSLQGAIDPTTPIPVSLALDAPEEQRSIATWWQAEPPSPAESDTTEVIDKEHRAARSALSASGQLTSDWSTEPPQWSPIAQRKEQGEPDEQGQIPFTAEAYLQQMPVLEKDVSGEEAQVVEPQEPPQKHAQEVEEAEEEEKGLYPSFATKLRKWLPFIVVTLLLLGLIGALASALFFV